MVDLRAGLRGDVLSSGGFETPKASERIPHTRASKGYVSTLGHPETHQP